MIEKTQSYKTSDGAIHQTIEAAKAAEIVIQVKNKIHGSEIEPNMGPALEKLANVIALNSDTFAEILGQKPRKPRASKPKGSKPAKPSAKSSETPKP